MKINWFWMLIFIVMMTVIGLVFDNIGASLAFGIGTGGIFGLIFSGKKSKKD